jgi:hypothetical protein
LGATPQANAPFGGYSAGERHTNSCGAGVAAPFFPPRLFLLGGTGVAAPFLPPLLTAPSYRPFLPPLLTAPSYRPFLPPLLTAPSEGGGVQEARPSQK